MINCATASTLVIPILEVVFLSGPKNRPYSPVLGQSTCCKVVRNNDENLYACLLNSLATQLRPTMAKTNR